MRIPTLFGVIKRRFLINYRAHPKVIKGILPAPFEPKLHRGYAIAGICLAFRANISQSHVDSGKCRWRQFKHLALTD
jgi:hypothetical protein